MNEVNVLIYQIVTTATMRAPVDTGNLKANGLAVDGSTIIGGNDKVPYFKYTNKAGTKNEFWFDNAVLQSVRIFASRYGYRVVVS